MEIGSVVIMLRFLLSIGIATLVSGVADATVVEYFNPDLKDFFITADPTEQAFVDTGAVGRWQRTGNNFATGGSSQVCRFYGNSNINPATGTFYGPNSHFYTVDPAECAGLKAIYTPNAKSWKFESNDFQTTPAANGGCPAALVPVYRAYNNGFAKGIDSNHRITTNRAAYLQTVSGGSIGEGVVMCAPVQPYFVATNGNDAWSGMLATPNAQGTDGPFATFDITARSRFPRRRATPRHPPGKAHSTTRSRSTTCGTCCRES